MCSLKLSIEEKVDMKENVNGFSEAFNNSGLARKMTFNRLPT